MSLANLKKILQRLRDDTVKMSIGLIKVNAALTNLMESLDCEDAFGYLENAEDINDKIAELGRALAGFTDTLDDFEKHGRPLTEMNYE